MYIRTIGIAVLAVSGLVAGLPAQSKTFPVSEITISANFDELWKGIDRVGDDLELRTSTACPTFRVARMTIAGR